MVFLWLLFVSTTTHYFSVKLSRVTTDSHDSVLKVFHRLRQTKDLLWNHAFNSLQLNNRGTLSGPRTKEHAPLLYRKFPSWTTIGQFHVKAGLAYKHCFPIGYKKRQRSSGYFLYHSASYVFYYESELKASSPSLEWFLTAQQSIGDFKVLIWRSLYKV